MGSLPILNKWLTDSFAEFGTESKNRKKQAVIRDLMTKMQEKEGPLGMQELQEIGQKYPDIDPSEMFKSGAELNKLYMADTMAKYSKALIGALKDARASNIKPDQAWLKKTVESIGVPYEVMPSLMQGIQVLIEENPSIMKVKRDERIVTPNGQGSFDTLLDTVEEPAKYTGAAEEARVAGYVKDDGTPNMDAFYRAKAKRDAAAAFDSAYQSALAKEKAEAEAWPARLDRQVDQQNKAPTGQLTVSDAYRQLANFFSTDVDAAKGHAKFTKAVNILTAELEKGTKVAEAFRRAVEGAGSAIPSAPNDKTGRGSAVLRNVLRSLGD